MKMPWLVLAIVFAPAAWIGCSSDPPVSSNDTSVLRDSGADGKINLGDGSTEGDGSTLSDGGANDGAAALDSGTKDSGPVIGPVGPSVCDGGAFGAGGVLSLSSPTADDRLDSVTPDELSIAWTTGNGGSAVLSYSDRASTADAFGAPQSFAAGTYTADRVALSPDGLRLIVVKSDRSGFEELTRANRTGAGNTFSTPPTEGPFANNVNLLVPTGSFVGDPVIDASDVNFFYSQYDGTSGPTLFRANRLGFTYNDSWGIGFALDADPSLEAQGAMRRQPTGVSADARTLFVFDQTTSTERVSTQDTSSVKWGATVDYGQRLYAVPTESCGSLYYSAMGATTLDLFTATR
ncbi:MAG: hypothetical protein ABI551_20650 [Polyangiaceae bacterium]